MDINIDDIVYAQWGLVRINATLVFTWAMMAILAGGSWLITRRLLEDTPMSRWQNGLEAVVDWIRHTVQDAAGGEGHRYLPFIGTLFLFIAGASLLSVVPGFHPPTASLSTAAALAACVFVAVPVFGIAGQGFRAYLLQYLKPTPLMLPFHVIGELSRTVALAVRLFGNMTSGALIVGVLLSLAPLLFPVVMQAFGLLVGLIQAYVFAILALVYIASAARAHAAAGTHDLPNPKPESHHG